MHKDIQYYYKATDTLEVAYAYQNMGNTFFLMEQMDSVRKCINQSLNFLDKNPGRLTVAADKLLGLLYSFQGQYEQAEKTLLKVIAEEPNEIKKIRHYMTLAYEYLLLRN